MWKLFVAAVFATIVASNQLNEVEETTELEVRKFGEIEQSVGMDVALGSTGCDCYLEGGCGCCLFLYVPFFIDANVCANVTFNPGYLSAGVQITWGNFTIFNFTVSGPQDHTFCTSNIDVLPPGSQGCLKIYDLGFVAAPQPAFKICAKAWVQELRIKLYRKNLGCFEIPVLPGDNQWGCSDGELGETYCWSKCGGRLGFTDGENYFDSETGATEKVTKVGTQLFISNGCQVGMENISGVYRLE